MPEHYKPRVIIKFHDNIPIPYNDGADENISAQQRRFQRIGSNHGGSGKFNQPT